MTTDIIVLDVSHHQGDWPSSADETPWEAMKNNGVVGIILKATEGTTYVDATYQRRYQACKENGIAVCSYHYLRHGDVEQQMEHFVNTVAPENGERLVLDWEEDDVTLDEVQDAVAILLNLLDDGEPANIQVTIYGSSSFLTEHMANEYDPLLARTSLWVARYSDEMPYWPDRVWPTWTLWQCTSTYSLDGYGPLDGNRFNGSDQSCLAWFGPAKVEPQPKPEPPDPRIDLLDYQVRVTEGAVAFDIEVRPGTAVAIKVNDVDWRPS